MTHSVRVKKLTIKDRFSSDEWEAIYLNRQNPCIYIGLPEPDQPHIIKFGETSNIIQRMTCHKKNWVNFRIIHVFKCNYSEDIETTLKKHPKLKDNIITFKVGTITSTEIIQLDNTLTLQGLISVIHETVEETDNYIINEKNKIAIKQQTDRDEMLTIRQHEIDVLKLEVQKLTLQLELEKLKHTTTTKSYDDINPITARKSSIVEDDSESISDEVEPSKDPPIIKLTMPKISEPQSLGLCYNEWVKENGKQYFETIVRPPWKKTYGNAGRAMTVRYCHMRPYFNYLDKLENPREAIRHLDEIRLKYHIVPAVFIKYCFYHLIYPVCDKKPPAISPYILRTEMRLRGLPAVEK